MISHHVQGDHVSSHRPLSWRVLRSTIAMHGRDAQMADIGVEPRSGRSLPAIRATAVARARSDPERRHGLGMLKRRAGRVDANLTGRWIDLPMPLLVTERVGRERERIRRAARIRPRRRAARPLQAMTTGLSI